MAVTVPSFEWSAFYYADILDALIVYKRTNAPELTDEDSREPTIQLLRMMAIVGHLNNMLADLIANESTGKTSKLPETIRNQLRMIDYELSPASPGTTDILFKLNRILTTATEVIPELAQIATQRSEGDVAVIFYEVLSALTAEPGNALGAVFSEEADGTFTDHTASANGGVDFTPWPTTMGPGCSIYFGHATTMFDQLDATVTTTGDVQLIAWEYYDGNTEIVKPTSVTNLGGGQLQFDLTSLLGNLNRAGAIVRVTLVESGTFVDIVSTWNGTTNVGVTGLLGQTTANTDLNDYVIGSEWRELSGVDDQSLSLGQTGALSFVLPQDTDKNWRIVDVNGFEGFFIRMRIVEVSGSTQPVLNQMDIDQGAQYVLSSATQGRSVIAESLGSSNGEANQSFEMANTNFVDGSQEIRVDGVAWTKVNNFLSSFGQDQHYRIELGEDDRATVIFGDGVTGQIPPIGQGNVVADYRHNAESDGNVGPGTLIVDKTGLTFVETVTNPRQASGWNEADSASTEALEKAKVKAGASIRTTSVANGSYDLEELAKAYTDSSGSRPFVRARNIEEGFGPKTNKLVVVAAGGGQASSTLLSEFETYLNGDKTASPPVDKKVIVNQTATPVNFTERTINIVAEVEAPSSVSAQGIRNALSAILQPDASEDNGVTFIWDFGDKVPTTRINHEIFAVDSKIRKVNLISPAADTLLSATELPKAGTIQITVVDDL